MASNGKVAFITGANRGIGFETARELGEKGVHVVLGSRDEQKGREAARKLRQSGIEADSIQFDVGDAKRYRAIYDFFDERFGKLDILVNNAGIMLESLKNENKTSAISSEVLRKTFDTNFFNLIELTQVLLPLVEKAPAGRIVNLSSILGSLTLQADPKSPLGPGKPFAYDASKTALNAFTIHLAGELRGTKIKVNSAHPGWVKTAMGGSQAPMEVSEGGKTSAQLALLPDDGPTGGYFHLGKALPW
ncbi:MAG: SDR family oxidoreductase [Acidobacteriaceae bacterium]|nr:SDR family oxidoreductase [Acidobacteriaceae bacterium]